VDDVELANYFAGLHRNDMVVAPLPLEVQRALKLPKSINVLLSDYTVTKCKFRHTNIGYSDYLLLPHIISSGFYVRGRQGNEVDCFYLDSVSEPRRSYRVCIKRTIDGRAFVATFHRQKLPELRRLYRRARQSNRLVRHPSKELARLLGYRASSA
jgi:hypothetical protein